MKREIKFRAVFYNYKDEFSHFSYWGLDYPEKGMHTWLSSSNNSKHKLSEQFTGLKDKNGVDIYDGDILDIQFQNRYFKVVINYASFDVQSETKQYPLNEMPNDELEVIGNIHENPELLK